MFKLFFLLTCVAALKLQQDPEFDTADMDYDEECGNRMNYKCWKKGGHSLDKEWDYKAVCVGSKILGGTTADSASKVTLAACYAACKALSGCTHFAFKPVTTIDCMTGIAPTTMPTLAGYTAYRMKKAGVTNGAGGAIMACR